MHSATQKDPFAHNPLSDSGLVSMSGEEQKQYKNIHSSIPA